MKRKINRVVLVGCGGRGLNMFAKPIVEEFKRTTELVGLCDINQGRMDYFNRSMGLDIATFISIDRLLKEICPDQVIVATKDSLHHKFIIKALRHGCNVITEKPMTTDAPKCRQILQAEKSARRKVTVTFNYRFIPYVTKIRELLSKGIIGRILSVDFNYQLDRAHGADYFRRWHRRKENSGGLLVHKSTHHFDLINWFLDQDPVEVFALGKLSFYGPTRKERGKNCRVCRYTKSCGFYLDINKPSPDPSFPLYDGSELYAKVEHYDGYIRDQCVFDQEINIEDTMNLAVRYSGGVQMSYSLNAHCIYEGWRMALNGVDGRLEAEEWHSGPRKTKDSQEILIHRWKKPVERVLVPMDHSNHGGGDVRLHRMLFDGPRPDPHGHMASSRAGVMSTLTGVAANRSIATGKKVAIVDLLRGTGIQLRKY